ncbi:MAG TPA: TonB-dependent receptor [Chitinophagales bacterium]|nr:TonB-dependent receptor [Chitinophagales bacterium]
MKIDFRYLKIPWLFPLAFMVFGTSFVQAQTVQGYVIEETGGKRLAIIGAVVGVMNTTNATTTDDKGMFTLTANPATDALVTSYLGYKTDTTYLKGNSLITITVVPLVLNEVEINARKANRLEMSVMDVEVINSGDLVKDACCNLSESFENTATVDVNFTDAVSGAKEIRMLGLDGMYTQIMVENMPSIRSLGQTFGLNYIPGPLMSSIQINKGAGSVVNGYEGMTGQINVELKKPQVAERLYVNLFLNQDVRTELNVISAHKFNDKWSQLTSVHGLLNFLKMDMNHDHYIDNPLVKGINLMHRFTYLMPKSKGMVLFGAIANIEDRMGGSYHFKLNENRYTQNDWGMRLRTNRVEAFAKTGFNLPKDNFLGVQYKYLYQNQFGYIGRRNYSGLEHYGYFNFIYQKNLNEKEDMVKAGVSVQTDYVTEQFDTITRTRLEVVPGMFAEATLNFGPDNKVAIVGGFRVDQHNLYGTLVSPRFNLKWNILYDLSLRVSAGRGYRTPTLFAENFGLLANSRQIQIDPAIKMEEAWNYGASLNYKFFLGFREGNITVDYYRTDFMHQVVVDLEDARLLHFYNLSGKSFANAAQIEVSYEVVKRFDVKLAYKFEQAKTDYASGRKIIPLRPQHRGLISLQYTTKKEHWRFNTGLNWFGKTRIPDTSVNDEANRRPAKSKDFFQLNAQVTFKWKQWEVYLGGENLLNFSQPNPIIAGDAPFSNQFDASLIWGPLRGAMAFTGVRFVLK